MIRFLCPRCTRRLCVPDDEGSEAFTCRCGQLLTASEHTGEAARAVQDRPRLDQKGPSPRVSVGGAVLGALWGGFFALLAGCILGFVFGEIRETSREPPSPHGAVWNFGFDLGRTLSWGVGSCLLGVILGGIIGAVAGRGRRG